ncbi:hypothetical protein HOY82DRAFT_262661 [Tuber indicum]|nr:hypothetical protein HOY82DRAFT_262661 [Tuber indicum]
MSPVRGPLCACSWLVCWKSLVCYCCFHWFPLVHFLFVLLWLWGTGGVVPFEGLLLYAPKFGTPARIWVVCGNNSAYKRFDIPFPLGRPPHDHTDSRV